MSEFTCQNRGGKGVKCYKIMEKTGNVVGVKAVNEGNEIMLITTEGIIIRLQCSDISVLGRITSGVKLMDVAENITVASIAKVREKKEKNSFEEQAQEKSADVQEEVTEYQESAEDHSLERLLERAEADASDDSDENTEV